MAVGIYKAVHIHESKVFRFVMGCAAGGEGLRDEIVDLLAAFTGEAEQGLNRLRRIADGLGSKLTELVMSQQHDRDRLADDDTGSRIIGELRIE